MRIFGGGKLKTKSDGFTLIEILVYIAIFAVSATFLIGILTVVLKIQNKQGSATELNQQISFVNNTIQRLVQDASLVDMTNGTPSNTLTLRTSQTSLDPTKIYLSGTTIYLQQGDPSSAPKIPLTNSSVKVDSFSATKYENPGGPAVVQIDLTLRYNSQNPQNNISRTLRTAITRISAASFDSSVLPTRSDIDIGGPSGSRWQNGYFSGDLNIYGRVGIGGDKAVQSSVKLKTNGDIFVNNVGNGIIGSGIILKTPDGNKCYSLTVNNSGAVITTPLNCSNYY